MSATREWFCAGGPVMPVILALSIVLYATIAFRWLMQSRRAGDPRAGLALIQALVAAMPLLGLLGSVGGIMATFDLAAAGVRGSASAKGVGEALVATEFGLAVAVPGLVLHWWLARRAQLIGARNGSEAEAGR